MARQPAGSSGRGELEPIDRRPRRRVRSDLRLERYARVFASSSSTSISGLWIDPASARPRVRSRRGLRRHPPAFGRIGDGTGTRRDVRLGALLEVELEVGVRDDVATTPAGRPAADVDAAVEVVEPDLDSPGLSGNAARWS